MESQFDQDLKVIKGKLSARAETFIEYLEVRITNVHYLVKVVRTEGGDIELDTELGKVFDRINNPRDQGKDGNS